jgi:hypothetical protein
MGSLLFLAEENSIISLTQILHAHLRMRSSSLNEHLYIKNIINNPKCLCGEIESTYHYSFKCLKYTRQRNRVMFGFLAMETHCYFWCCTSWKRLGIKVDKDAGVMLFCILNSWMSLWFSRLSFSFNSPSLSILQSRLTSRVHHDIVPKYYYYGPRLTQILHARLRMRSSSLNEHLYIKYYW